MSKALNDSERTALAMLRSGSSWKEASEATGVTVERLRFLWDEAAASPSHQIDRRRVLNGKPVQHEEPKQWTE